MCIRVLRICDDSASEMIELTICTQTDSRYKRPTDKRSKGIGEELFPVLGEFVGVVGGQQLVLLEHPKSALLDPCLENTLAIPFVRFLPRKGNPPPG
ncbi:hypothetical protein TNCV_4595691 [Trichonephila clavipes]|uniref:Uncharacterized protein n=1 Tax=Trichonephila clavipes TaxID=2585209 RepID=A0A8X6WFH3_TRICX|nr:hypothetical protein TNCV_4595691 [Trichonephila clavipes]